MNKLLILLSFCFMIVACASKIEDGKLCVKTIDGYGEETEVEFWVEEILVKEIRLSEDVLKRIGETACRYSDWNIQDKNYFYIDNNRINMIVFNEEKNNIHVWTHVVKTNSDGSQSFITNSFDFDLNGNILLDDTGDIKVYSYEY